jgi:hypothetical protein
MGHPVRGSHRAVGERLAEFIPFLDYDLEIRKVICSTNAIESLNARYRRAVKARGHFPTEQAALKCLYLVTRSLDPTGTGRTRWAMRWKPALNAFAITFGDRSRPPRPTNHDRRKHRSWDRPIAADRRGAVVVSQANRAAIVAGHGYA